MALSHTIYSAHPIQFQACTGYPSGLGHRALPSPHVATDDRYRMRCNWSSSDHGLTYRSLSMVLYHGTLAHSTVRILFLVVQFDDRPRWLPHLGSLAA